MEAAIVYLLKIGLFCFVTALRKYLSESQVDINIFAYILLKINHFQVPTPPKRKYKKRRQESSDEDFDSEEEEVKQCFGPGCIEPARAGSKYCNDKCGMKLATKWVQTQWMGGVRGV